MMVGKDFYECGEESVILWLWCVWPSLMCVRLFHFGRNCPLTDGSNYQHVCDRHDSMIWSREIVEGENFSLS